MNVPSNVKVLKSPPARYAAMSAGGLLLVGAGIFLQKLSIIYELHVEEMEGYLYQFCQTHVRELAAE